MHFPRQGENYVKLSGNYITVMSQRRHNFEISK